MASDFYVLNAGSKTTNLIGLKVARDKSQKVLLIGTATRSAVIVK